jgi:Dolichyl-phosphate-mannose-protein mannosyltransferase
VDRTFRPLPALLLIAILTFALRLWLLPSAVESRLTPDGARFLNIARCISRGEGFSTPEAWPVWMNPPRLPMPETFKEPGYPYAIAAVTPLTRDPFHAGLYISLLAGLLIPFAVYRLGRRLSPDPFVGWIAALFSAASPVLIQQSVFVMAESLFALTVLLAFLAAAPHVDEHGNFEPPRAAGGPDLMSGIFFGLAFLVRAQALVMLPALMCFLWVAPRSRVRVERWAWAAVGALIAVSPLLVRNLRTFGTPLHSDVSAFGLWPYVDTFALTHALERPPSATGYALSHLPQVAAHFLHGVKSFVRYTLPDETLGHISWLLPLAIGGVVAMRRARIWGFALVAIALSAAFLLSLNWIARYFASVAPFICLIAGLGAASSLTWLTKRGVPVWVARTVMLVLVLLGFRFPASHAAGETSPAYLVELGAAWHEAAFLRSRTASGEAVMGETTSYWAWECDRPAVHPVVADSARFEHVMSRLHVRYAALPTSRLAGLAARYPGGRLPSQLVLDHADPDHDISIFEVRTP